MSPDLNPMDYTIWGILEARVAARKVKSLGRLRLVVQEELDKLPRKSCVPQSIRGLVEFDAAFENAEDILRSDCIFRCRV